MISSVLLRTQPDRKLASLAADGSEPAFEAIVQRYRRPLLLYCRRLLLSEARSEDVVQQALLSAWSSLRSGTEVRDLRAWLYRITHNHAVNELHRAGYDFDELSESLSGSDAPEHDLERRTLMRETLAAVARLPARQREAILQTAVNGHSYEQVALELGITDTALRGLVQRARASLRSAVAAVTPAPLVVWCSTSGRRDGSAVQWWTELLGGGGSVGGAAVVVKSAAVLLASAAMVGGTLHRVIDGHMKPTRAHRISPPRSHRGSLRVTASPSPSAASSSAADRPVRVARATTVTTAKWHARRLPNNKPATARPQVAGASRRFSPLADRSDSRPPGQGSSGGRHQPSGGNATGGSPSSPTSRGTGDSGTAPDPSQTSASQRQLQPQPDGSSSRASAAGPTQDAGGSDDPVTTTSTSDSVASRSGLDREVGHTGDA